MGHCAQKVESTATGNVLMQMIGTGRLNAVEEARTLARASFAAKVCQPRNT